MARVLLLSFCSQAVQVGVIPALLSLRLNAGGSSVATLGLIAAAPWLAVLLLSSRIPALLARYGYPCVRRECRGLQGSGVKTMLPTAVFEAGT